MRSPIGVVCFCFKNSRAYAVLSALFFFFQAEDGIRDIGVTGVQTCALPISIADIGAGSGYFTRKFVWAVQDKGMVYAVDIEPGMLKYNEEMIEHLHTPYNAKFVVAKEDDPLLPPKSVDLVFLCNAYHHLEKRADYFTRVKATLKPKGRVAIIDFYHDERSGNLGFSKDHLVPRDTVIKEMTDAGYTLSKEHTFLPKQYFLEFVIGGEKAKGADESY